jgi:hypothetical protein
MGYDTHGSTIVESRDGVLFFYGNLQGDGPPEEKFAAHHSLPKIQFVDLVLVLEDVPSCGSKK